MRIAIVGTQNSGKSTVIKNFLEKWDMYENASPTYRDLIKKDTKLNQLGSKESQEMIRNSLVEQAYKNKDKKYCIHDRCILDNLIYSLWLADKGKIDDDQFITETFHMTRETLKLYDIIFILQLDNKNPIPFEVKDTRDLDETYRKEINELFLAAHESYMNHEGLIFPLEDCPGVIVLSGDETKKEKTHQIADYIDSNGDLIEPGTLMEDLENQFAQLQKKIQDKKSKKNKSKQ